MSARSPVDDLVPLREATRAWLKISLGRLRRLRRDGDRHSPVRGLAPAVLAIVTEAVIKVARRALHHPALVALAVAAFLALAVFGLPFPVMVLAAAIIGGALGRMRPHVMAKPASDGEAGGPAPLVSDDALHHALPTCRRAGLILAIGLPLWLGPVAIAFALTGADSVYTEQGLFFSGTALVTFGGAYAVLAFVAQRGRRDLRLAHPRRDGPRPRSGQTTPGRLIMVVQFVAILGAFRDPGTLDPWGAAVIASLLTTWVTIRAKLPLHLPRRSPRRAAARQRLPVPPSPA